MRRHAPLILALALALLVLAGGVVFVFRPLAAPRSAGSRGAAGAPVPVRSQESRLTSAFSFADPQDRSFEGTISAPVRVSEPTRRRLAKYNRGFDPAPPEYLLRQGIVRVAGTGKRVALTFDDGPSVNTARILEILDRYDSHATFFVIGRRVMAAPQLARAVVDGGSELGNHTQDHEGLYHQTEKRDQQEILWAEDALFKAAEVRPAFVRPKGGMVDDTGMGAIKGLNKTYVYWDVAGFDTVPEFTAADIRDTVLEDVRPGSVILLHETNPRTVEALPQILEGLRRRGYEVQTLTGLLAR